MKLSLSPYLNFGSPVSRVKVCGLSVIILLSQCTGNPKKKEEKMHMDDVFLVIESVLDYENSRKLKQLHSLVGIDSGKVRVISKLKKTNCRDCDTFSKYVSLYNGMANTTITIDFDKYVLTAIDRTDATFNKQFNPVIEVSVPIVVDNSAYVEINYLMRGFSEGWSYRLSKVQGKWEVFKKENEWQE